MTEKALKVLDIPMNELTTPAKVASFISRVQKDLESLPQMETVIAHYHTHGVYGREMFCEPGIIIGAVHLFSNLNVLTSGRVTVISPDGIVKDMKPGDIFMGSENTQRLFVVHESSSWLTILGTHERDVEKIEKEMTRPSMEALCLG